MVFFSFFSTILYFETGFDYDVTMQDIDKRLGDSILVCYVYKIMGVELLFSFSYFQVVTSIMSQIRSGYVSCYTSIYVCCTFCAVGVIVLPHLLMGKTLPERTYQIRI